MVETSVEIVNTFQCDMRDKTFVIEGSPFTTYILPAYGIEDPCTREIKRCSGSAARRRTGGVRNTGDKDGIRSSLLSCYITDTLDSFLICNHSPCSLWIQDLPSAFTIEIRRRSYSVAYDAKCQFIVFCFNRDRRISTHLQTGNKTNRTDIRIRAPVTYKS